MPAGQSKSGKESTEMAEQATTEDPVESELAAPESTEPAEAGETAEGPATGTPETADTETPDTETSDVEEPDTETSDVEEPETSEESKESTEEPDGAKRKINWSRVVAFGLLPGFALLLALVAGFSRWEYVSSDYGALPPVASEQNPSPATESINAARDSTIKMLSYKPDTVEQQLNAARDLLTGDFRDSYTSLINDVVIPGAKQKQISAVASVPAAASVSADPKHAVVLVFVNQTVVVGQDLPSDTASSVRVTMEKVDDRWLISEFEPV
jgi:Mce-associated membrane protein